MKSVSSMAYFTIVVALFLIKGGRANLDQTKFFSADIASVLPSSTCKSSESRGPNGMDTLRVVDRNGACYKVESGKQLIPSLAEILSQDQSRVDSIQSRHASSLKTADKLTDKKTSLPSQTGASLGTGNYIVNVGLGTPKKYYSMIFDTGSDLTWTQCTPCVKHCYQQKSPIFNPKLSKTYSNVSCTSPQCALLVTGTGNNPGCAGSTCVYGIQYGDNSFSVGYFAKETVSLGADVFPNFLFGCGQNNNGLFGRTDGLLGLGRSQISLVSQTTMKYGKVFSYCLPTSRGSNGYLSFGKAGISPKVKYTPFSRLSNNFYFVDISGISVGGMLVPLKPWVFQTGTIIDSGTVVTRLPKDAYVAFRDAFKKQMTRYKLAPAFSLLDTCYDFTGLNVVTIPTVNFIFRGNANVNLGINGIFVAVSPAQVCLAFAGNTDPNQISIFGNIQQQTQQVVYDVAGGKLGFAPGGCS